MKCSCTHRKHSKNAKCKCSENNTQCNKHCGEHCSKSHLSPKEIRALTAFIYYFKPDICIADNSVTFTIKDGDD